MKGRNNRFGSGKKQLGVAARFAILLFGSVLLASCSSKSTNGPVAVYGDFQSALDTGSLEGIEATLSQSSLDRLEIWNAWTLIGEEGDLRKLAAFDRYMILLSRMLHDDLSNELWVALERDRRNDERDYIVNTLNREVLAFMLEDLRLGEVTESANVAGAPLYRGNGKFPAHARFAKEGDQWKLNLVAILSEVFNAEFARVSNDQYRNLDRVSELMKILYGDRFDEELYTSPLRAIVEGAEQGRQ